MLDNGIVGIGFGAYLGVIIHAKLCPGMMMREVISDERWWSMPLLRCLVGLLICLPFLALYLLTASQISNVYLLALMKTFVPTFVSGFIVFGLLDHVCESIGILKFSEAD